MNWEIVHIWVQLFYALLLCIVFIFVFHKHTRSKTGITDPNWKTSNSVYIYFRYQAKDILKSKFENNLEDLEESVSDLISKELALSSMTYKEQILEIEEKENQVKTKVSSIWKSLKAKIPKGLEDQEEYLLEAFIFELDSGIIRGPCDLQGRRRSHRLKIILNEEIKCSENKGRSGPPLKAVLRKFSVMDVFQEKMDVFQEKMRNFSNITFIQNNLVRIQSFAVLLKTVCLPFVLHVYDYFTDIYLITLFYNLAHGGDIKSHWYFSDVIDFKWMSGECIERIPDMVNATSSDIQELVIRNLFSSLSFLCLLLASIVPISLLFVIPSLKTVQYLYYTERKMICSKVEKEETLDIFKVMNRCNLCRSESGIESNLQVTWQMAIYLSLSWQMDWIARKDVLEGNEHLFQISSLWSSFAVSLLSMSNSQYKSRMLLHQYSTDFSKKMFYLAASILHTIFISLVWISVGMTILDITTVGVLELQIGEGVEYDSGNWGSRKVQLGIGMCFPFLIAILSLSHILRLPTSSESHDITSLKSEVSLRLIKKQMSVLAVIVSFNAVLNIFLICFSLSSLTPAILEINFLCNLTLPEEYNVAENLLLLTPSTVTEGNARRNFVLLYTILLPLCFVGSFSMLHLYFKDNTACMRFEKNKDTKHASWKLGQYFYSFPSDDGFWVDLNELNMNNVKSDGEIASKTETEMFDQEVMENVLKSLPSLNSAYKL